ncbi:MAG: cytochrome C oxidase subunit IV family protein [Deltaproteobacteria bacterium]|nr:cytochrome C oxidase subunit IV family protein [Deltaproteobacteria bacterium]
MTIVEGTSIRTYLHVFAALLLLLFISVAVAQINLGLMNLAVALLIAAAKAALVIWYFMHVRVSPRLVLVAIGAAVFMLTIAFILTMTDYVTRA